jgi:LysM domain
MFDQTFARRSARLLGALAAFVTVVAGLPASLVVAAARRFGHASPLYGVKAPWHWSVDDLHSWARRTTTGFDSSAQLVDLFFRLALVIAWVCVVILIYTVVDELFFQIRHGMPSARHRKLVGLGSLGRNLATALVALLPLSANVATPALATSFSRPAASVVQQLLPQRDDPLSSAPTPPPSPALAGWSVVEVQRGDSVWSIAEDVADGRDVAVVAHQIVVANLGTVMGDGQRFSTPALIEPGWMLNVPFPGSESGAPPSVISLPSDGYVVQPGDSYWEIAENHLDQTSTGGEIAAYTETLMALNAPLLGYSDARLIRPGDVLQLGAPLIPDVVFAPPTTPPVSVAAIPGPQIATDAPPVTNGPLPPVPSPTSATSVPGTQVPLASVPSENSANTADNEAAAQLSAITDKWSDDGVGVGGGLAAAVMLAGGAIAALGSRRRQQLRGARVGARLVPPSEQAIETEMLFRSLSSADQLARIDLALRSAAHDLAEQQARPLAIEINDDGEIRLYTDRPAGAVSPRWLLDVDSGAWRLPADVTLAELAGDARRSSQPCPAILHLGESAGGRLFLDLEAVGSLTIDAAPSVAASIVRGAAASLAVSPFAESSRVFTIGVETESQLANINVESLESLVEAIATLRSTVGSIAAATSDSLTTFELRVAANGGEAWEPSLLLSVGEGDPADLAALVSMAGRGGRGVGVMIDRPVPGAGAVLRADDTDFVLEPWGRRVSPVGLSAADVSIVDDLLRRADQSLLARTEEIFEPSPISLAEFCVQPHEFVVHVLGQVAVQSVDGTPVAFDRSKAQELVVWLSQHRFRPTRTSARTALWDLAVRDATFSNVVSDARRAMARVVPPPEGDEWVGRTMNEDLPLHELVVSDAELLADRVAAARGLDSSAAIAVLRPGVALLQGMPFAGTSYLWPDAEGITSALVLMATNAAADLASRYLSIDDVDGVFWATGQGLKVLAGHEELIALRMRAHARRGDLSGVRSEWESYERALSADTWAAAEPSPKLVHLRRELLSPLMAS